MPTTTSTTVATAATMSYLPLKATSLPLTPSISSPSSSSPDATVSALRSLYNRAAKAFLLKDIALTHSLLTSAFSILSPPSMPSSTPDRLDSHRKKWDILRISLESTVHVTPVADLESLPAPLRSNLMLSGQALAAALHSRSVKLFAPSSILSPTSAFLPPQILLALVFACLKLGAADVGRWMVEDWLARRDQVEYIRDDLEGYEKVIDVYCLHVLPRQEDWDYARDFLQYESVLSVESNLRLQKSLSQLHDDTKEARRLRELSRSTTPLANGVGTSSSGMAKTNGLNGLNGNGYISPSRTPSPSPSMGSSSSSSSLDTTSTHTVVPRKSAPQPSESTSFGVTPLNGHGAAQNGSAAPLAAKSASRSRDASRSRSRPGANGSAIRSRSSASVPKANGSARLGTSSAYDGNGSLRHSRGRARSPSPTPLPLPPRSIPTPYNAVTSRGPDIFVLIRNYVRRHLTLSNVLFMLFFVLFPLLSLIMRMRRRRRVETPRGGGVPTTDTVADVRRRLQRQSGQGNIIRMVWDEVFRAVFDAVKMGGRGLV